MATISKPYPSTPKPLQKRKRAIGDEMDRSNGATINSTTASPGYFARLSPMFKKIGDSVVSAFSIPRSGIPQVGSNTAATIAQSSSNKRVQLESKSRRQTPPDIKIKPRQSLVPGAYPLSPGFSDEESVGAATPPFITQATVPQSSSQVPKLRKDQKWDRIAQQTRFQLTTRLGRPSPIPPRKSAPAKSQAVLRAEQRDGIHKRLLQAGSIAKSHRNLASPIIRRECTDSKEPAVKTNSYSKSSQIRSAFADIDFDDLTDDAIGLEQLIKELHVRTQRSEKLKGKAKSLEERQWLQSPELWEKLTAVAEDFREKKIKEAEDRLKPPKAPAKEVPPPPPFIREPSKETLAALPDVSKRGHHDQLHVYGKTPINKYDLLSVKPGQWLNDSVINAWFDDLCRRSRTKFDATTPSPVTDGIPRYHAFNTQWYPTASAAGGIAKVSRWATRAKLGGANLLKAHKILIPCHVSGNHWTLLAIFPQRRLVRYYDSLHGNATRQLNVASAWIQHELAPISAWNEDEWTFEEATSSSQTNGSDCGVFTSYNALATFYAENTSQVLPSEDMVMARHVMEVVLLSGGFQGEFDLDAWWPGFRLETDRGVANGIA